MSGFRLRLRLEPGADHLATLRAYPATALEPDFAVVTSGFLAIEVGQDAVAYRHGVLVPMPAGADEPSVWLPDYLGGFIERLARAVIGVRPGHPTEARLLDAPAALTFVQAGRRVVARYHDDGRIAYRAVVSLAASRAEVAAVLTTFLDALDRLNPRLAEHPEVVDLHRQREALAALASRASLSAR